MTLKVLSARISYRGADRFDITRKTGGVSGAPFAPSWAILRPALTARALAKQARSPEEARRIEDRAWAEYMPLFVEEMRASYRAERSHWDALLQRERVVLVCFCADHLRCHRAILRETILPSLGAIDCGEIANVDAQKTLQPTTRTGR